MKILYWTMAVLTVLTMSLVFAVKTSRPVEVVNKTPTAYLCEGTTMIDQDGNATYNSQLCQGGTR